MTCISVDDIEISYEIPRGLPVGKGQTLALLLHGAAGSSRHWEPLLAHLSDQIYPLLLDLPGHGCSGGAVPDSVDSTVDIIARFLTAVGAEEPLCCIGHSLGGLIAQRFALRYPDRIARLVLIATSAFIRPHPDFLKAVLAGHWDLEALRPSFGADVPISIQDLVLNEYPKTRVAPSSSEFMKLGNFDLRKEVSAISMPTLVIAGDDDVITSPRQSRFLDQKIPETTLLIISGGGHYVHVEQPRRVADALAQFLRKEKRNDETSASPLPTCR